MRHEDNGRQAAARSETDRRVFLRGTAVGIFGGLASVSPFARAQDGASGLSVEMTPFNVTHDLKPLPYAASSLNGLSERLIESHWWNNYGGSVRALNEINRRLADALEQNDLPAYVYNDRKREHLMRTGSVVLHELYFDSLGGSGDAGADVRAVVGAACGDFDRWETEFRRIPHGFWSCDRSIHRRVFREHQLGDRSVPHGIPCVTDS